MALLTNDESPPLPPFSALFPNFRTPSHKLRSSIDPFTITENNGFLPCGLPLLALPSTFEALNKLLNDMPIIKADGQPGLLATFKLGPLIDSGVLPDLTSEIDNVLTDDGDLDLNTVTALFRDYSFLASAYLLEPCWEKSRTEGPGGYGLGRQVLPKCIAGPLVKTAEILDIPPFMSYAASYALYNYCLFDPSGTVHEYSNLRLIRAFEQGLDPSSSEAGFILTHIHMVAETPSLVSAASTLLDQIESSPDSFTSIKDTMRMLLQTMSTIESHMELMWNHSQPKHYNTYRTFIFGITSQSMFPDGVIYEGQFISSTTHKETPQFYRGESGANDAIIPLLDYLLEIPFPSNPLTSILRDFKSYRPKPHRQFLSYIQSKSAELHVRKFLTSRDKELAVLLLNLLDHVRSFRWRHWLFAREYIIKRSKHPTATGGSPIISWLPNQLLAVMELMEVVWKEAGLERIAEGEVKTVKEMMSNVGEQRVKLSREVERYCLERGV